MPTQSSDRNERPLPHNDEAERVILGAILNSNEHLKVAADKLNSGDFFDLRKQKIFHAMLVLRERDIAIDTISLLDYLESERELETVGGAPHIASLQDGVPLVVNVAHYATIIHEKAQLRQLIHACHAIQNRALDTATSASELYTELQVFTQHANGNGNGKKKLHPKTFGEISLMNLKPSIYVIAPILPVQGLGMLYSKRGSGKTYVALEIAYSVAIGAPEIFNWHIPQARPVLYVDGEMPANRMQDRLKGIAMGHGLRLPADPDYLRIITPDLQDRGLSLNISSVQGQNMIEDHLRGEELLILDNLSALCKSGKENEGDDWVPVAEWALRLRQRGISVLFIHHAGKGGEQRGTSRREDLLDCVIAMRPAAEHSAAEGLRCEIHMEKLRNEGSAESVYPFELTMQRDKDGAVLWLKRPLKEVVEINAMAMFADGMSIRDVAEELHISKHRAHQIKNLRQKSTQ